MSSPKHPRKKRSTRVDITKYNAERRERNLKHEIRITEKKMDKLLKRNISGKVATPGKKKVWNDSHKEVVKVLELPKKQGIAKDSERFTKLSKHIESLKKLINSK